VIFIHRAAPGNRGRWLAKGHRCTAIPPSLLLSLKLLKGIAAEVLKVVTVLNFLEFLLAQCLSK
jgi:hypothetical protein